MLDPSISPDPVVRAVAARRNALLAEAARLDSVLAAYASRPYSGSSTFPVVSAVAHYSMMEGAECSCVVCAEWDTRRSEFVAASRLVPKEHKWSTCACGVCRFVGRIHFNYLAAANTRDLLIGVAFHATYHSPFSEQVMRWFEVELQDRRYTVNWRAREMSRYPVEWWLERCEGALGPVVSGEVFRESMHVTDMYVHFGSSLEADGAVSL
jgi:hypothetical protein